MIAGCHQSPSADDAGAASSDSAKRSILFLVGRDFAHPKAGGGDVQAWGWARYLAAQGWQVEMICQSCPSLPGDETIDGVRVRRIGRGWRLSMRAWRHYRGLARRPDVVYEDPIGADRIPFFAPLYARTPVMAVWHQVSMPLLLELYGRVVGRLIGAIEVALATLYRGCWLWAPSQETADDVCRVLSIPSSNVMVVHPTAPPGTTFVDEPETGGEGLLAIGVIRPYKAFHHIINSMPKVLAEVPSTKLVIMGRRSDASYEASLRELAHEVGVAKNITWKLDASDSEKAEAIANCRALLMASRLEGYGIATIEANAQGKPIIASSGVPGAAVIAGVNGLRFEYGDTEGLAQGVLRILTDDAEYKRLVAGSLGLARDRTIEAQSVRFERLLSNALAAGPCRPWLALFGIRQSRVVARVYEV